MALEREAVQSINSEKIKGGIFFKASKILALGTGLLFGLAIVKLYQHLKDPSAHQGERRKDFPKGVQTYPNVVGRRR